MNTVAIVVILVLVAGFLCGGAYSMWQTSRLFAGVLAALAVLAAVGVVLYLV